MHSSTSNSNDRLPRVAYRSLWVSVLAAFLVLMAGAEVGLRRLGFHPSITDGYLQWSRERARLEHARPGTVAVLGASRAQLGFAPRAFERAAPGCRVAMLAVNGYAPLPTLEDIGQHSDFAGVVIVSYHPGFELFVDKDQGEYVDYYRRNFRNAGRYEKLFGAAVERALQERLVVFSQDATWTSLLQNRMQRPYLVTDARRFRRALFRELSPSELDAVRRKRLGALRETFDAQPVADDVAYARTVERLRSAVTAIQGRGGTVVLVRYPSSGEHLRVELAKYPRERYWDRLADETGAVTVYWKDVDALAGFDCPDFSHLDHRDAVAFTQALAQYLAARGILDCGANARHDTAD